jgi:glutamate 5-kinase
MVIVNSDDLNNVNKVVAGEEVGTLFLAHKRPDFDFKKYLTERPYFKA